MDEGIERHSDEKSAAVAADVVVDPTKAKLDVLRAKLVNARGKIVGGKRQNMLDQIADGCVDAIDAMLATLPT